MLNSQGLGQRAATRFLEMVFLIALILIRLTFDPRLDCRPKVSIVMPNRPMPELCCNDVFGQARGRGPEDRSSLSELFL